VSAEIVTAADWSRLRPAFTDCNMMQAAECYFMTGIVDDCFLLLVLINISPTLARYPLITHVDMDRQSEVA
jgi:hypothetical protein